MIQIIDDLDIILGTNKQFLLGTWLQSAESWANNE
jgi:hypothetical protein